MHRDDLQARKQHIDHEVRQLRRGSGRSFLVGTFVATLVVGGLSVLAVSRPELTKPKAIFLGSAFFGYEVPREDPCIADARSPSCGAVVTSLSPSRPRQRP